MPCFASRVGHLSDLQALQSSSISIAVFPSDERAALTHLVIAGSSAEEVGWEGAAGAGVVQAGLPLSQPC